MDDPAQFGEDMRGEHIRRVVAALEELVVRLAANPLQPTPAPDPYLVVAEAERAAFRNLLLLLR